MTDEAFGSLRFEIAKLELGPDDVLVVKMKDLNEEKASRAHNLLKSVLPGQKVLIHSDTTELSVLKAEA